MPWPEVLDSWNEVQHDPVSIPQNDFEGLSLDDSVELITDWFFENFEDPAQSTPYESREGGYQYIWGGPYDTRDIIENVFADSASEELSEAAIDYLENISSLWVPNSTRRQPPEDSEDLDLSKEPEELHAEMQQRVTRLEDYLSQLPVRPIEIGHNNPPEEIDALPLTVEDREEISRVIVVLKQQTWKPDDAGKAAAEAAASLEVKGRTWRTWLAQQGDTFITEAVKNAGKETGKWAPRVLFVMLIDQLFSVITSVMEWLSSIGITLPF